MCKALLFVKDDNCVYKEHEETNERGITTKGWRCTF
jgi:hypothetical protein